MKLSSKIDTSHFLPLISTPLSPIRWPQSKYVKDFLFWALKPRPLSPSSACGCLSTQSTASQQPTPALRPQPTHTLLSLEMATLARFSRKALSSSLSSQSHRGFATEASKAIMPSLDRVKWDYRGQRKIIPLGQWVPKIAVDAYVAPNVVLAGQVAVLDGSSVWSGSVLRGDLNKITIGFCSNVQERCVIHAAWSSPTGEASKIYAWHPCDSGALWFLLLTFDFLFEPFSSFFGNLYLAIAFPLGLEVT